MRVTPLTRALLEVSGRARYERLRIQGHLLRSFLPGEDPHTVLSESLHGLVQILLRITSSLLAGVLLLRHSGFALVNDS